MKDLRPYKQIHLKRCELALSSFYLALTFTQKIMKNRLHRPPYKLRGEKYNEQAAYSIALVMAYTRPFSQSNFEVSALPKKYTRNYSQVETQVHQKFLQLRNDIYAHTSGHLFEVKPVCFGNNSSTIINYNFWLVLEEEWVQTLQKMLSGLIAILEEDRKALIEELC